MHAVLSKIGTVWTPSHAPLLHAQIGWERKPARDVYASRSPSLQCFKLFSFLFFFITTIKVARCRHHSHVLRTFVWPPQVCRVRSLLAKLRSQANRSRCFHAFRRRKRCSLAKVASVFVGGAPLICAPRHRYIILLLW